MHALQLSYKYHKTKKKKKKEKKEDKLKNYMYGSYDAPNPNVSYWYHSWFMANIDYLIVVLALHK